MESTNIVYQTKNISEYYGAERIRWDEFYPSERAVIEYVNPSANSAVIDMGCACGGLGLALKERFGISNYTGVDINVQAINYARQMQPAAKFYSDDFLKISEQFTGAYDLAFSLSCADWNVQTVELLRALFGSLKSGGKMIVSSRLTNLDSVVNVAEARQRIAFGENTESTEWAPYKVYRLKTFLDIFMKIGDVSEIYGFGYWGKAPATVEGLGFNDIFYMVFAIEKKVGAVSPRIKINAPNLLGMDLD